MPANRNDITRKPIMTTAPTKNKWVAYTPMGRYHMIWADTYEEAQVHATEQGWTLQPQPEKGDSK